MTSRTQRGAANEEELAKLQHEVHPRSRRNPQPRPKYDLVVLGAGPAGLAAVERAFELGASVALVERKGIGGTSLATGSIPSKALLATSRLCSAIRRGADLDIAPMKPLVDFAAMRARILRAQRLTAEPNSLARLEAKGADVFFGEGVFKAADTVRVGKKELRFHRAIIATGSRPRRPHLPGLGVHRYCDSDTVFHLSALPRRLLILGGGPLGCEMAQGFQRLGSQVTIVEKRARFLHREDHEAAQLVSEALGRDGVDVRLSTELISVREDASSLTVELRTRSDKSEVTVDELLVSVGRQANIERLSLKKCNVTCDEQGIRVSNKLQTTNSSIFAAGDVCTSYRFANAASVAGRVSAENALKQTETDFSEIVFPWVTFTEPEIGHVGLQPREAREQAINLKTYTSLMSSVDRAVIERCDDGFVKLHIDENTDRIVGATIVGANASEMIDTVTFAIANNLGPNEIVRSVLSYPSRSQAIWLAAQAYLQDQTNVN